MTATVNRAPFDPVGDRARWRIVYEDLLVPASVGDVITYVQVTEAIGQGHRPEDLADRSILGAAVRRASGELLLEHNRVTAPVPKIGYRITEAHEHTKLAQQHQGRSRRELVMAHRVATHTEWDSLNPVARSALELIGHSLSAQLDYMHRLDIRQRRLDQVVEAVAGQQDRTAEEMVEMRARLERMERKLKGEQA